MPSFTRALIAIVLFACAGLTARADNDAREDRVQREALRQAVESGQIRPLSDVLSAVRDDLEGELVGVEIEHEDGAWIYEFRVARPGGRLVELYVDAATARIVKSKDK